MENQGFTDRINHLASEFTDKWGRIRKFSEKVGITEHQGRTIFAGQVPKWDALLKIAKAYDKTVDWLLTGDDPNDKQQQSPPASQLIHEPNTAILDLLQKAQRVLNSETHKGAALALAQNIETFDEAVTDRETITSAKDSEHDCTILFQKSNGVAKL